MITYTWLPLMISSAMTNFLLSFPNSVSFVGPVVVFVLQFYFHGKQLWPCRDNRLT